MKLMDEPTSRVFVSRDPGQSSVELQVGEAIVHLTREEARRLASLLLFQAARLDPVMSQAY